ncbi:ABC transporter permease [Enterococcus sp. BWM-S5]|uniref:ABC transporter permease n=1 Tax=Enterococcus larvae TaxID=2794352 RepID=A0ABS4CNU0_9ENTE|nr:ABC transporter permease [Enterococcus larvae]MBP1048199.1 ABC transporter permease [Enterococcus larvae]
MGYLQQTKYVLRLQAARLGGTIAFYALQQIIISLGITIGFTFLYAEIDKPTLLYLATGAPTMIFIMSGLTALPMQNATAKTEGHLSFLKTLPVNRLSIISADTIIWVLVMIPGIIISTLCAQWLYAPGYALSWTVIPAFLISSITCIAIGYGFSYLLSAEQTMLVCMVLAFGSLMFSPINFPIERLPEWLQFLHRLLPIDAMAQIIRSSFAHTSFSASPIEYIKLLSWCIIGYASVIYFMNKK